MLVSVKKQRQSCWIDEEPPENDLPIALDFVGSAYEGGESVALENAYSKKRTKGSMWVAGSLAVHFLVFPMVYSVWMYLANRQDSVENTPQVAVSQSIRIGNPIVENGDVLITVDILPATEVVKGTETVRISKDSAGTEAAETAEITEAADAAETAETAEITEVADAAEITEVGEVVKNTETARISKDSAGTEVADAAEVTETAEITKVAEVVKGTEVADAVKSTEASEKPETSEATTVIESMK